MLLNYRGGKIKCFLLFAFFLLSSVFYLQANIKTTTDLTNIAIRKTQTYLEIHIILSDDFSYKVSEQTSPPQIVFDLSPVRENQTPLVFAVESFGIRQIRTLILESSIARIILDATDRLPNYRVEKDPFGLKVYIWPKEIKEAEKHLAPLFIGFGYGRYKITGPRYQSVYETGREIYSFEICRLFQAINRHHFGIAAGIMRFTKKGHATITREETEFRMTPLFLGFRYLIRMKRVIPWVETGLDYSSYREESEMLTTSGRALGYHIQGGFYVTIPKVEFIKLNIYTKHIHLRTTENNIDVNLGGWEYGIGLTFGLDIL